MPPSFISRTFTAVVNESSAPGFDIFAVAAASVNTIDALVYSITAANPAGALSWFSILPVSGMIKVSPSIPGGMFLVDRTLSYPAGAWTVNVSLMVTNAVGQTDQASILITVINIAPRIDAVVNATIAGNATAGASVATVSPVVWTAYSRSSLVYSLISATTAGRGLPAFTMPNTTAGAVVVANVSYTNVFGGRVNGPDFNQNVQPVLTSAWIVLDTNTGLAAQGSLAVTLSHSNRAPYWIAIPVQFVPQAVGGPFGAALSQYVVDLDLALNTVRSRMVHRTHRWRAAHKLRASNAGQSLTFAIVGGNSNGAFSIDTSTGRLTVADESKTTGLVSFNLTIAVRDAGIDGPISWAYTGVNVTTTLLSRPPVVAPYNFSIPELSPAGTPLGIVTAYSLNDNRTLTYSLLPLGYYPTFPFSVTTIPSQSGTTLAATGAIAVASGMTVNTYSQGPRLYLATLSVQDNDPVSNFVAQSLVSINVSYVPRPPSSML